MNTQEIISNIGTSGTIKVLIDNIEVSTQDIYNISNGEGMETFLENIYQNNPGKTIILEKYIPNGSSRKRVGLYVYNPEPSQAPNLGYIPQQRPIQQPINNNDSKPENSNFLKYKLDDLTEKVDAYKKEIQDLRNKNQKFFDENRELSKKLETIDDRHKLELLKLEMTNKSSLSGVAKDLLSPENINNIKDLVLALKSDGSDQPVAQPKLLEGLSPDDTQLIETVVNLLKSCDTMTIGKIVMIVNQFISHNDLLDSVHLQLFSAPKQEESQE